MKIALATNFLYPEGLGGTELYCHQLANALLSLGHEVFWFVPNFNKAETITGSGEQGLSIVRFAAVKPGQLPEESFVAQSFVRELKNRGISLVHIHEFGGFEGISTNLLRETRNAGIKTIVTLHLVLYICHAGTLRRGGKLPCDGEVILNRCVGCVLFSDATSPGIFPQGLSWTYWKLVNGAEKFKFPINSLPGLKNVYKTFRLRLQFIQALKTHADEIVSLTQCFKEILVRNGIPGNKISCISQGTPEQDLDITARNARMNFVFIGRVHKEKGIGLILKAAERLLKVAPLVNIDIYGPIPANDSYSVSFLDKISRMSNIHYKGVLKPTEVMNVLSDYKAALLPSFVAEMAPLIIMEAAKQKVPVIASDVPGSAELIAKHQAGLVFKYGSSESLVEKILDIERGNSNFGFLPPDNSNFIDIARKYISLYERPHSLALT